MKAQISISNNLSPLITPTIFETIIGLALKHKAINLASGFPDWEIPEFLTRYTYEATLSGENQYTLPGGHPLLLEQLAIRYSKIYQREIKPANICVGIGASGIQYDIMNSYLNQGDEVIAFEPYFEFHIKQIKLLGATVRLSQFIEPQDFCRDSWGINFAQLESLFNENTRMIILNSPHNPTGKVFTKEEYEKISEILQKYPKVLVLSDEVYETLIYDDKKFTSFANISNMFERTISSYSLGKMFSCTGWRVGYCTGPEHLIKPVKATHAIIAYSVPRPSQVGFAKSLIESDKPYLDSNQPYFKHMKSRFEKNRNAFIDHFKNLDLDLEVSIPEGGYFIVGNLKKAASKIPKKYYYQDFENVADGDNPINCDFEEIENPEITPDVAFSKYMAIERGVAVIPLSSFFQQVDHKDLKNYKGRYLFRIALCRKQETLQSAFERLKI